MDTIMTKLSNLRSWINNPVSYIEETLFTSVGSCTNQCFNMNHYKVRLNVLLTMINRLTNDELSRISSDELVILNNDINSIVISLDSYLMSRIHSPTQPSVSADIYTKPPIIVNDQVLRLSKLNKSTVFRIIGELLSFELSESTACALSGIIFPKSVLNVKIALSELSILDMNKITTLLKLETLIIDHCSGEIFSSINLKNMLNLRELSLVGNNITTFSSKMISGCKSLELLDLSHNNLTEITMSMFNRLSITKLDLHDNQISVVSKDSFLLLPNLRILSMYGNPINTFPNHIFDNIKNLDTLLLDLNFTYSEIFNLSVLKVITQDLSSTEFKTIKLDAEESY